MTSCVVPVELAAAVVPRDTDVIVIAEGAVLVVDLVVSCDVISVAVSVVASTARNARTHTAIKHATNQVPAGLLTKDN